MATDDDASSSATSFRQRTRKSSKASSVPSPLSNHNHGHSHGSGGGSATPSFTTTTSSHLGLSNFFLSTDKKSSSAAAAVAAAAALDPHSKVPSQLKVRHLELDKTYAGYLTKFTPRTFFSRKQWKRRYFILHHQALHCFKSSDPQHPLLESIALTTESIICVTDIFSGKRYCLQVSSPGEKSWYVLADTASEMAGWLRELKATVQRTRGHHPMMHPLDARPRTEYSDSSELSELTSSSHAARLPIGTSTHSGSVDVHSHANHLSRAYVSSLASASVVSVSRPALLHPHQHQRQPSLQDFPPTSLSPPPRAITPKPASPTSTTVNAQRQSMLPQQHAPHQHGRRQTQQPDQRKRRNSSLSAGVTVASDYVSFGSVMEQAEAMATAQETTQSSSWSLPTKTERTDVYATVPRSKRESTISTMSGVSSMSFVPANNYSFGPATVERALSATGGVVPLPNRSVYRLTGSQSRPISPASVSSRPTSPNFNRASPRNSLVISPPPRSIHRPASTAIRHSTQILPPPQNASVGLPAPTIPSTVNGNGYVPGAAHDNLQSQGSLSRITSIRHQRDMGASRQSVVPGPIAPIGTNGGTGSLQERFQRNASRMIVQKASMSNAAVASVGAVGGHAIRQAAVDSMTLIGSGRPISPTPSLSAAPTLPLPAPPRPGSNSPSRSGHRHSSSVSSLTSVTSSPQHSSSMLGSITEGPPSPTATSAPRRTSSLQQRAQTGLEYSAPRRSEPRARSDSHEGIAKPMAKLEEIHVTRRAMTPSPRLSGIATSTSPALNLAQGAARPLAGGLGRVEINAAADGSTPGSAHSNGYASRHQMSLPIHSIYALPAPPTRQQPARPISPLKDPATARPSNTQRGIAVHGSLRPLSAISGGVPTLGGGVARRSSKASPLLSADAGAVTVAAALPATVTTAAPTLTATLTPAAIATTATATAIATTTAAASTTASTTATTVPVGSNRDSIVGALTRLSIAALSLPPRPTTAIPPPPLSATPGPETPAATLNSAVTQSPLSHSTLPAPPTTALPDTPDQNAAAVALEKKERLQVGFAVILEEEEEEVEEDGFTDGGSDTDMNDEVSPGRRRRRTVDLANVGENNEDEDEEEGDGDEFAPRLRFEDLDLENQSTSVDGSTATTITAATMNTTTSTELEADNQNQNWDDTASRRASRDPSSRPEYYATRERKVVEYIFPSESFPSAS